LGGNLRDLTHPCSFTLLNQTLLLYTCSALKGQEKSKKKNFFLRKSGISTDNQFLANKAFRYHHHRSKGLVLRCRPFTILRAQNTSEGYSVGFCGLACAKKQGCKFLAHSPLITCILVFSTRIARAYHAYLRNLTPATLKPSIPSRMAPGTGTMTDSTITTISV